MSEATQYRPNLKIYRRSQADRVQEYLDPQYKSVWSWEEDRFLRFLIQFGKTLPFYTESSIPEGTWSDLFRRNTLFLLLRITTFDLKVQERRFKDAINEYYKTGKGLKLAESILHSIKDWWKNSKAWSKVIPELEERISELDRSIPKGCKECFSGGPRHPRELTNCFAAYNTAIRRLKSHARTDQRKTTEQEKGSPMMAMLIAFKRLMDLAGASLNQFGNRHLAYYYGEILGLFPSTKLQDQAFLSFQLADNISQHRLRKGTAFISEESVEGKHLTYALDQDIVLNHTDLEELIILVHRKDPPEHDPVQRLDAQGNCYFLPTDKNDPQKLPDGVREYFPGFAIASEILNVDNNGSTLTFEIELSKENPEQQFPNDFCFEVAYSGPEGNWISVSEKPPAPPESTTALKREASHEIISWTCEIKPDAPPIHPCSDPMFMEAVSGSLPIFRFTLSAKSASYYRRFCGPNLTSIKVTAENPSLQTAILQNDFGVLDPNAPFEPFGPIPAIGGSFFIGHPSIFKFQVEQVDLDITWYDLPTDKEGFVHYYDGYPLTKEEKKQGNAFFKMEMQVLRNGRWETLKKEQAKPGVEEAEYFNLFDTLPSGQGDKSLGNAEAMIDPERHLSLSRPNQMPGPNYQPFTDYHTAVKGGFIRWRLAKPAMAFGHKVYPKLLAKAAYENARKPESFKFPNPPYTPSIEKIKLGYKASTTLIPHRGSPGKGQFYHLLPRGAQNVSQPKRLLPIYAEGTHLFLGLRNQEKDTAFSMLFAMDNGFSLNDCKSGNVQWRFCHDDGWKNLKDKKDTLNQENFLADGTGGLSYTGIIKLRIPSRATGIQPMFTPNLGWLWIHDNRKENLMNAIQSIHFQAARVKLTAEASPQISYPFPLPINSITQPLLPDPAILSMQQPIASFGARFPETHGDFLRRASERLRHKNRAISLWDIQTLLLQRFPNILQVQCTPPYLDPNPKPGTLKVYVLPQPLLSQVKRNWPPKFRRSELRRMQHFIAERATPFVHLEVANAQLVRVQVEAKIRLKEEYTNFRFYSALLSKSLREMISPWYYLPVRPKVNTDIPSYSRISQFITSQPYVADLGELTLKFSGDYDPRTMLALSNARHLIEEFKLAECGPPSRRTSKQLPQTTLSESLSLAESPLIEDERFLITINWFEPE